MDYYFIFRINNCYIGNELKPTDKPGIAYGIKILNKSNYDNLIISNIIRCEVSHIDSGGNMMYLITTNKDIVSLQTYTKNFTTLGDNNNLITFNRKENMSGCVDKLIEKYKKSTNYKPITLEKELKKKVSKSKKKVSKSKKKVSKSKKKSNKLKKRSKKKLSKSKKKLNKLK